MKVVAITQARMTSTRLPGKVMLPVLGKPLLAWHLERVARAATLDDVVVATTTNAVDDPIVEMAGSLGMQAFRGSEGDVLSRYAGAARMAAAEVVVRVTSDCPLIDPAVIDATVGTFLAALPNAEYGCNRLPQTYPRGMDTEVVTAEVLFEADQVATESLDREHVTLFVWRQPKRYRVVNHAYRSDESRHRWTVDTPEDLDLIERLIGAVAPAHPQFTLEDCLAVIRAHPDWEAINRHVEQKKVL